MSYPRIKDKEFSKKINKKFNKYEIPQKKRTFNQICFPKKYELQMPQKFLAEFINPKTPYNGVLIFHKIGAGKTCTAVNIGEKSKKKFKIIVVVPASLIGNFRDELRTPCAGEEYLTNVDRKNLSKYHPSDPKYKAIIDKSDKKIDKYYEIYSYNKFVKLCDEDAIKLNNTVLIIDEIQNMVSEKGKSYKIIYDAIHSANKTLKVVLLSATPMFDKPIEVALTLNLLRLPKLLPTGVDFSDKFIKKNTNKNGEIQYSMKNENLFKKYIKGYVSYFKGAPDIAFPATKTKIVRCTMSNYQYNTYLTALNKEMKSSKLKNFSLGAKEIMKLPNNFLLGSRVVSNIAFPEKKTYEKGLKLFDGKYTKSQLEIYSTKFFRLLRMIKYATGPVFVYSNFRQYGGMASLIKVLDNNGYKNYVEYGEGAKRYALISGDIDIKMKDEIRAVFNQKKNCNGSKLRIVLGTPSVKEGISFYNLQQLHILEPYWNWSRMLQIIGRGNRYCSHKNLCDEKRKLKIYIYLAVHPKEDQTVDQYIYNLSRKKDRLIKNFEKAMKEAAIDCELFRYGNENEANDIICYNN